MSPNLFISKIKEVESCYVIHVPPTHWVSDENPVRNLLLMEDDTTRHNFKLNMIMLIMMRVEMAFGDDVEEEEKEKIVMKKIFNNKSHFRCK